MKGVRRFCFVYAPLMVCALIALLPFAYLVCASVKSTEDFFSSAFLPSGDGLFGVAWDRLTLSHFFRLRGEFNFGAYALNSFFIASVTSVLATLFCAMGGYALAKFEFHGRSWLTGLVLGALVIPGTLLLAPSYQLLYRMDLLDTYAGLIAPIVAPAFGVYLFRQAMITGVPNALLEAARIDGCGEFKLFFALVLPLVRPMTGAFLMITYLGTWNNFIWPQVILQTPEKQPLSVAIAQLKGVYAQDYGLLMAGTLLSIAPVLILFLLLQRDFIAGLTSGAVKG